MIFHVMRFNLFVNFKSNGVFHGLAIFISFYFQTCVTSATTKGTNSENIILVVSRIRIYFEILDEPGTIYNAAN